jgi:molybdenum cofactor cytidylyltransferase
VSVLVATILAAGDSTRMGAPKALLPDPEGRPFVARLVRTFREAGLRDIVVVTGARHEEIAKVLSEHDLSEGVRIVRNSDPARGQLSSLWTALDATGPDTDAALMTLVDVPMTKATTIRAVIDAWERTRAPIVRPAIGERHGHPVLFDRRVFGELRAAPLDAGAKPVVHAHADELVNVPVDDEGCVTDVDTPEDYRAMFDRVT